MEERVQTGAKEKLQKCAKEVLQKCAQAELQTGSQTILQKCAKTELQTGAKAGVQKCTKTELQKCAQAGVQTGARTETCPEMRECAQTGLQTGALHRPGPEVRAGAHQGLQECPQTKVFLSAQAKLQTCCQAALHPQQPAGAQDCPGQNPQEGLRRSEDYCAATDCLVTSFLGCCRFNNTIVDIRMNCQHKYLIFLMFVM